jgi:hypothetical protein
MNIMINKESRFRLAGHVARTGERRMHTEFWWMYLREIRHLEGLGTNWRITLKYILKKQDEEGGLDLSGSGQEQVAGPY